MLNFSMTFFSEISVKWRSDAGRSAHTRWESELSLMQLPLVLSSETNLGSCSAFCLFRAPTPGRFSSRLTDFKSF